MFKSSAQWGITKNLACITKHFVYLICTLATRLSEQYAHWLFLPRPILQPPLFFGPEFLLNINLVTEMRYWIQINVDLRKKTLQIAMLNTFIQFWCFWKIDRAKFLNGISDLRLLKKCFLGAFPNEMFDCSGSELYFSFQVASALGSSLKSYF